MFAQRFDTLIRKYPQDADAFGRLAEYFAGVEEQQGRRVMSVKLEPQRLFDISQAGSTSRLARVIAVLIDEHILQRLLIVDSPSGGGGLATYRSYSEVPEVIHDVFQDKEFLVTPDNVRTVYTPSAE